MSVELRVRAFRQEDLPFPKNEDLSGIDFAETVRQYNLEMDEALEAIYPNAKLILETDLDNSIKPYITIEGAATAKEELQIRGGVAYVRDLAKRLSFNEIAVVDK